MARGIKPFPQRPLEEVLVEYPTLRQSLMGLMDNCALSTRFELEGRPYSNAAQARGIIGHRAAGEILRTMRQTGEVRMPVDIALEILYEVAAQRDVPDDEVVIVPMREQRLLRIAIIRLVSGTLNMERLIDVERRLYAEVEYTRPDGSTQRRQVTGQPDALLSAPNEGATVLDWKFGWGVPPKGSKDGHDDPDHISYLGYFQQRFYGFLVMTTYKSVQYVELREFYPLKLQAREGYVKRSDMEHIARELGVVAELLDRALQGGSQSKLWSPQPGKHCAYCPRPTRCPLSADVRMTEGGIATWAEAERAAREWIQTGSLREKLRVALQAWVDAHGPIRGRDAKRRWEVRWRPNKTGGGRTFGVYVPDDSDRGPKDPQLEQAFAAVAERARGAS